MTRARLRTLSRDIARHGRLTKRTLSPRLALHLLLRAREAHPAVLRRQAAMRRCTTRIIPALRQLDARRRNRERRGHVRFYARALRKFQQGKL